MQAEACPVLVVGIDIGSSVVKSCTFDLSEVQPRLVNTNSELCPLIRRGQEVEHDLTRLVQALRGLVDRLSTDLPIGFTSAMHSLVLLDRHGSPLCDALAWAHGAALTEADRLRVEDPAAQHRTGTPIHPMAWPAKLAWLREQRPLLWEKIHSLTDLKSYLLTRLGLESAPMDLSNASATGLWNQWSRDWDQDLLDRLELSRDWLPSVHPPNSEWVLGGRRIALGGGDGPIANLGVGAVDPGCLALSVGTSGAVRQVVSGLQDVPTSLFRYHLDTERFAVGGALSNGASVLDWLSQTTGQPLIKLTEGAWAERPGAEGLRVYPYFSGERAPFWRSDISSAILGWGFEHTAFHLARACLEGVAYCLRRLTDLVCTDRSRPVRCSGGVFVDPHWGQLLADVLGRPLSLSPLTEAGALGAALLTTPDYLERSRALPEGRVVTPEPGRVALYQSLYEDWIIKHPSYSEL